MSYEAFREQCVEICHDEFIKYGSPSARRIADAISSMPLPEVAQETVAGFLDLKESTRYPMPHCETINRSLAELSREVKNKHDNYLKNGEGLVTAQTDVEALRKENEQLQQRIARLEKNAERWEYFSRIANDGSAELKLMESLIEEKFYDVDDVDATLNSEQMNMLMDEVIMRMKGGAA